MESIASTPDSPHLHHHPRFRPPQPVADRIFRALRHHLRLLHRSDSNFFILGATGNVYTVSLSTTPSCSCPDRTTPCKHILFVLIRVLGVSLDDRCLHRRNLRPCRVDRLLSTPSSVESLADASVRQRFHQLFFEVRGGWRSCTEEEVKIEEGTICPICQDEMEMRSPAAVACGTCKNVVHEECLMKWRRSRGRRGASCVICRARWRDRCNQQTYLNLATHSDQHHSGLPYSPA